MLVREVCYVLQTPAKQLMKWFMFLTWWTLKVPMDKMGVKLSTEQDWPCEKCTLINPGRDSTCQACGNRKQSNGSWICKACAFRNPQSSVSCNQCGSEKVMLSASTGTSQNSDPSHGIIRKQWTCIRCTLSNSRKNKICSACGFDPALIEADDGKDRANTESTKKQRLYPDLTLELHPEIAQRSSDQVLKCPKCQSLLYDNAGLVCTVCRCPCPEEGFKPRPFPESSIPRTSEDTDDQRWSCPGCTFENQNSNPVCQVCGSNRVTELKPSASGESTGNLFDFLDSSCASQFSTQPLFWLNVRGIIYNINLSTYVTCTFNIMKQLLLEYQYLFTFALVLLFFAVWVTFTTKEE